MNSAEKRSKNVDFWLARLLLNKSGSAKLLFALVVATLLIGIIPQYSGVAQWQSVRLLIGWS
jgi:hypothetical protein